MPDRKGTTPLSPPCHSERSEESRRRSVLALLAIVLIAGAALAAYSGTFSAPFVLDDALIVGSNPSIRHLGTALTPPHDGSTVEGRPLVNLSLAINYAISGTQVWSYHAFNLLVHILAGWTLFGIVRRTLEQAGTGGPSVRTAAGSKAEADGRAARPYLVACVIALLWTLHPLQTESVTYVAQRAEALVGLFYLLTFYCFIRGQEGRPLWLALSVLSCLAGTATKEIIVTAPVLVFLYDRTFVSGSFQAAWKRRGFYAALMATWIPLGFLVLGSGGRSGTAGFGSVLHWSDYALTQVYAVPHYLRLALWPSPLVFDYGKTAVGKGAALILPGCVLLALLVATVVSLCARSPGRRTAGFLGAWFFAILAPTSLIPVATQTIAEHRMYLPLAAVVTALVLILAKALARPSWLVAFASATAVGLGATTAVRNEDYHSELALWTDTAAKLPDNERAHNNLGNALMALSRTPEALEQYAQAVRLLPGYADAEYNLGNACLQEGRLPEAIAHSAEAVRLTPANPDAHQNLGMALARSGRLPEAAVQLQEAMVQYRVVLQADPTNAKMTNNLAIAHYNLGAILAQAKRMPDAIGEYEEALRLRPAYPEAELNLGSCLFVEGRVGEAIPHFQAALRLRPNDPRAQYSLNAALTQMRRAEGSP